MGELLQVAIIGVLSYAMIVVAIAVQRATGKWLVAHFWTWWRTRDQEK